MHVSGGDNGFVPTRDFGGRPEDAGYLGVHGDVEVLLDLHRLVAFLNPVPDPATEDSLEYGGTHIADPVL